jgi:hypothetical protein
MDYISYFAGYIPVLKNIDFPAQESLRGDAK